MEEFNEMGDAKVGGEEVGDRGGAEEVAPCFPKEVTVHEDVLEGIATAAMGASGIVTGSGSEVIRVVGVKGVAGDELKACGL